MENYWNYFLCNIDIFIRVKLKFNTSVFLSGEGSVAVDESLFEDLDDLDLDADEDSDDPDYVP